MRVLQRQVDRRKRRRDHLDLRALPVHGIIGNDWFDRDVGTNVTSVSDAQVRQIGGSAAARASPRRLQVTTVADELKLTARARGALKCWRPAPGNRR